LLIGGDKRGVISVIDRDNMTGFDSTGDHILQEVQVLPGTCIFCGIFSTPSFWQGNLYVHAVNDVLRRFTVANGVLSSTSVQQAADNFKFPGAQTAVSSSGASNGIVWTVNTQNNGTHGKSNGPAVLFAYDAVTLAKLYSGDA